MSTSRIGQHKTTKTGNEHNQNELRGQPEAADAALLGQLVLESWSSQRFCRSLMTERLVAFGGALRGAVDVLILIDHQGCWHVDPALSLGRVEDRIGVDLVAFAPHGEAPVNYQQHLKFERGQQLHIQAREAVGKLIAGPAHCENGVAEQLARDQAARYKQWPQRARPEDGRLRSQARLHTHEGCDQIVVGHTQSNSQELDELAKL